MNILQAIGDADHQENPYSQVIDQFNASIQLLGEELRSEGVSEAIISTISSLVQGIREELFLTAELEDLIDESPQNPNAGFLRVRLRTAVAPLPNEVEVKVRICCMGFLANLRRVYLESSVDEEPIDEVHIDGEHIDEVPTDREPTDADIAEAPDAPQPERGVPLQTAIDTQTDICKGILSQVIEDMRLNSGEITSFEADLTEQQRLKLRYQPFLNHAYAMKLSSTGTGSAKMQPAEVMAYMDNPTMRLAYTTALRALFPKVGRDEVDFFYNPKFLYQLDIGKPWVQLVAGLTILDQPIEEIWAV